MEEDEQLRSFMLLMTYLLLKRRRDINNANIQRRNEIQRRIRHRYYFFQRQRRMLMVSLHFTRQFYCCNLWHILCLIITAHWWYSSLHSTGRSTRYYLQTKLTIPRYRHVLRRVLQFILMKIHKTIKSQFNHSLSHFTPPPPKKNNKKKNNLTFYCKLHVHCIK